MANLMEMAKEIVAAHASTSEIPPHELVKELREVYELLVKMEKGEMPEVAGEGTASEPAVTRRKAFGKNKITCMICGKEMKTLSRHLKTAHGMTPKEYRTQFNIPRTQPLAASNYSEQRRQMAVDRNLGENLAKARAARGKKKKKVA